MPAAYEPFPRFADWADLAVDDETFRQYVALLAADREVATPDALDKALRVATRSAAVDTGAIEGLYRSDRVTEAQPNVW